MGNYNENYFLNNNNSKNNSIESVLTPGESIMMKLKPNKKDYIMESIFSGLLITLIWAGIDIGILITLFTNVADELGPMIWFIVIFFMFHLMPVWIYIVKLIKNIISYKNIEYAFTDKRLIIRSGLIGIDFKSINFSDISAIQCKVGLIDKLFRVGDIYVTAQMQTAVLIDIDNPYRIMGTIQTYISNENPNVSYMQNHKIEKK